MSSSNLVRWGTPAAMLGGALWALFPLGDLLSGIRDTQAGTLAQLTTDVLGWIMGVVPLLLLLLGLVVLHLLYRRDYGRFGNVGFLVSLVALLLMFAGNAVEMASLTFSGSESGAGHSAFLIGFLLLLIGSVLLGVAVLRALDGPASRVGGLLLVLALPLGVLLGVVLGGIAPGTDLGFWAAITVPYGVAWVLLGQSLRGYPVRSAPRVA